MDKIMLLERHFFIENENQWDIPLNLHKTLKQSFHHE